MATTASESKTPTTFTAEQLLLRLLDLIRSTKSASELTVERVSAAMQQPALTFGPGHFGYGGRLTPEWGFGLEIKKAGSADARLDFEFINAAAESDIAATDICTVDFERFASELTAAGFTRETVWGEHGRVSYYSFERQDMSIAVDTRGEASFPPEKVTHECVRLVTVK